MTLYALIHWKAFRSICAPPPRKKNHVTCTHMCTYIFIHFHARGKYSAVHHPSKKKCINKLSHTRTHIRTFGFIHSHALKKNIQHHILSCISTTLWTIKSYIHLLFTYLPWTPEQRSCRTLSHPCRTLSDPSGGPTVLLLQQPRSFTFIIIMKYDAVVAHPLPTHPRSEFWKCSRALWAPGGMSLVPNCSLRKLFAWDAGPPQTHTPHPFLILAFTLLFFSLPYSLMLFIFLLFNAVFVLSCFTRDVAVTRVFS